MNVKDEEREVEMDKAINESEKKKRAQRGRKKQELKVELTIAYVPLPDQAAAARWREGMRILLNLLDRSEQEETARKYGFHSLKT